MLLRSCLLLLLIGTLSGCYSLDTHNAVASKTLPAQFASDSSKSTIAETTWREYFPDAKLRALLDEAIKNNLDLQIALQRIEAARSNVKLTNAALLPQVGVSVAGGVKKFGLYTMDGAGNATTQIRPGELVPVNLTDIFAGLQTSWEVDIWGKLRSQRKAAISAYLSSIEGTNFVISNLIADVASQFNEILALDNQLEIVRQNIQRQRDALDVVRLQKEAGRATELAVRQFAAQLLASETLERSALQQLIEAENRLNLLLGRYPSPIERNKETFFEDLPAEVMAGLPSQMLANRPDIREAEFQVQASQYDLQAVRAAFYPQFNITGTLGFQAFNPEFLFIAPESLAYSLMGGVTAPLVNMGALKARFNTAKANQLTAMYNYQKTILTAYVEVANTLANIHNLQVSVDQKKQQASLLTRAVDTAKELYKYGRASYLEVLVAQQSALQSNLELIQSIKQQRSARIAIYKALGGGWR